MGRYSADTIDKFVIEFAQCIRELKTLRESLQEKKKEVKELEKAITNHENGRKRLLKVFKSYLSYFDDETPRSNNSNAEKVIPLNQCEISNATNETN